MKKNIMIFIGLGMLALITLLTIYTYETEAKIAESRLKSILGSSLFNVYDNYDDINQYSADNLEIDMIKNIKDKLIKIEIYSTVIDNSVEQEYLTPIANNLLKITNNIEDNYKENKQFTIQDKNNYKKILETAKNLIPTIHKTYYKDNSTEGAEPILKVKDTEEFKQIDADLLIN